MSSRRPPVFRLASLCLRLAAVLATVTALAHASIVRSLNLEDLTARADRIFSGRCVEVREVRDTALGQAVTESTFVVTRAVKGNLRGRITIRSLGGASPEGPGLEGIASVPRFRRGEKVVLFLYGDSLSGLTSPVGFGQGKFTVLTDKSGREVAINASGNRTLFRGLSKRAEERIAPAASSWRSHGDIPPDALLDAAASLSRSGEGGAP